MAKWKYVGLDKNRKKVSGEVEAETMREFRAELKALKVRPTKIVKPSVFSADLGELFVALGMSKGFSQEELTQFFRQLGTMLDAGVPILDGLEIIVKAQKNPSFKKLIRGVTQEIRDGKSFSEAMRGKKGFEDLLVNLIKAGEAGGVLDSVILKIVDFMEKQEKTKKTVKKAMILPALIFVVSVAVICVMMLFVIPQFVSLIQEGGQELPAITQFVIDVSDFFGSYFVVLFLGAIAAFVLISQYIKTRQGKAAFDQLMMKMPIFGTVVIKGNLASFARTLSTMLNAGIPIIDSLEICVSTLSNSVIAKDISRVRTSLAQGKTMVSQLVKITYFPTIITQMVKIGEETGQMDSMLLKISAVFENDVDEAVAAMSSLIGPLVVVFLGGIIGVVMIAMYLPIFMSAGSA